MNTHKIIRNLTASDVFVNDTGCNIIASSDYIVPDREFLLWSESENVQTLIDGDSLIVLVGDRILSKDESKVAIRLMPILPVVVFSFDGGTSAPDQAFNNIVDGGSSL